MPSKLIIAIDGPAGSGKSTVAKILAKKLKVPYVDTGAMYRAATLGAMNAGIDFNKTGDLVIAAKKAKITFKGKRVFLNGREVTKEIRTPELTKNVFYIAQEPLIRREMVKKQRAMGKKSGAVMEGRDIGTMVFPDADFKFFLEADPKVRARRRYRELVQTGKRVRYSEVLKDLIRRDKSDKTRQEGPLRAAQDAFLIDTTSLTIDEVVDRILARVAGD